MPAPIYRGAVKSSLPYQLLLLSEAWYFTALVIVEVLLFIYKWHLLPYPTRNVVSDVLLFITLVLIEAVRNVFARRGNLTESTSPVALSLALTVPVVVGVIYFMVFQTYVLRLELIALGFELVLIVLQSIFAVIAVATFAR